MWNNFFATANLLGKDQAAYVPDFLKSPEKYCSWETVEDALHRSDMYWELIMPDGSKRDIEVYKPAWARTPDQDKKLIHDHIVSGKSFVILSYSRANARVKSLCAEIERHFDVNSDIHVYGARDSANSFKCHYDHFANFIIQCEGETDWVVYKNRATSLWEARNDKPVDESKYEVDWKGVLKPGDMLYIPDRAWHKATPTSRRLSMSIPCMPTVIPSNFYDRTHYTIT
jgi:hypothetical protein